MKKCKSGHKYYFICTSCCAQKTNKFNFFLRYKNKRKIYNKLKQIDKRKKELYSVWLSIPNKYYDFEYFVSIDGMPNANGELRGLAKLYKEAENLI